MWKINITLTCTEKVLLGVPHTIFLGIFSIRSRGTVFLLGGNYFFSFWDHFRSVDKKLKAELKSFLWFFWNFELFLWNFVLKFKFPSQNRLSIPDFHLQSDNYSLQNIIFQKSLSPTVTFSIPAKLTITGNMKINSKLLPIKIIKFIYCFWYKNDIRVKFKMFFFFRKNIKQERV